MTPTEMVVITILVAAGVALVGLLLLRDNARTYELPTESVEARTDEDPVKRLSETLQALRKLSELRDEEVARREPLLKEALGPESGEEQETTGWAAIAMPVAGPSGAERAPESGRDLRMLVGEAFSPSAPVSRRDLFAGRAQQMEELVDTVYERGQHAVIYGERGVGKTSLASVMTRVFDGHETQLAIRVNCDSSDNYDQIWRKVFEQAATEMTRFTDPYSTSTEAVHELLRKDSLHPNDVRRALDELAKMKEIIVFIDEFDTLQSREASRLFADTIKMLSDQLVATTIVLIGVADDLDDLIEEHGSVRRSLVQIHMPRMSTDELAEIVNRGLDLLNMKCEDTALQRITHLSQGFPHYTHLLAQVAARKAIEANRTSVETDDIQGAIGRVVERVHQSIREAYEVAVASSRSALYEEVLTAAALAPLDDRGYFSPSKIRGPLRRIGRRDLQTSQFTRHLNAMCEPQRGPALKKKAGEARARYRFADPLLQPYVLMRAIHSGLIDETDLGDIRPS